MDFSEALTHLKNGEKVRRKSWDDDYYIYYEEGVITDSYDKIKPFYAHDVFSDDWEICNPILKNGTLVKTIDETVAIILDYDDFAKFYFCYTENECVEKHTKEELIPIRKKESEIAMTKFNVLLNFMRHLSK